MKFLTFIRHPESYRASPPPPALMEAMGKFVEKSLKAVETLHEPFGRGRNKRSIPGPGSSDPVLCPAKLTGHLVGSSSAPQQNCVDLPNQA